MFVPVGPHAAVLRTKGMRIRAIGEWQYLCLSWAPCSCIENERNEIKSNRRMAVFMSQLGPMHLC